MTYSSISWIDFSEQDRRSMMEAIDVFRPRDTRDELGLGSIRDAFATLFFPGTSTLQTRARYFFFVPWLYRHYEERRVPSNRVEQRLRGDEVKLIDELKAAGEEGVIGQQAGSSLQRFPSSIYWNGLRLWGILRYSGSQSQYHRGLDRYHRRQPERTDDGEPVAGWNGANWDPGLPGAPLEFPNQATFRLTPAEAKYLWERLLLSCRTSVLATLVDRCDPVDDAPYIWMHPQLSLFPGEQRAQMEHARRFADAMYGAALLYNLMLAELRDDEELTQVYQEEMGAWQEDLGASWGTFQSWDRTAFWRLVRGVGRIPVPTQHFVNRWLDLLNAGADLSGLAASQEARNLVRDREIWLKRGRSRFESRRHLELWSGAASAFEMDFRWFVARRLTNDIIRGLREESHAGS